MVFSPPARAVVWFSQPPATSNPRPEGPSTLTALQAVSPKIEKRDFILLKSLFPSREALINSLFAFILEFLCNARNGATRIASYLRSLMTKQYIKILIKANSIN
jgi:hypothetical protein